MANVFKKTSIERTAHIEVIEISKELVIECTRMQTLIAVYGLEEVGLINIGQFLEKLFVTVGVLPNPEDEE